MRLKYFSDIATLFGAFEKAVNDLKKCWCERDRERKKVYMLRTLPETMSNLRDLMCVLKEEDQTTEDIKSKILMKVITDKDGGENSSVSVQCEEITEEITRIVVSEQDIIFGNVVAANMVREAVDIGEEVINTAKLV